MLASKTLVVRYATSNTHYVNCHSIRFVKFLKLIHTICPKTSWDDTNSGNYSDSRGFSRFRYHYILTYLLATLGLTLVFEL